MISETIQSGDWKGEKHVPVIEVLEVKDGSVTVEVSVGKEIPHPNTPEHHIAWVELYFQPEGENFPRMIGRVDFTNHEENLKTEPKAVFNFQAQKSGKLLAMSYCNIHGLWQGESELKL